MQSGRQNLLQCTGACIALKHAGSAFSGQGQAYGRRLCIVWTPFMTSVTLASLKGIIDLDTRRDGKADRAAVRGWLPGMRAPAPPGSSHRDALAVPFCPVASRRTHRCVTHYPLQPTPSKANCVPPWTQFASRAWGRDKLAHYSDWGPASTAAAAAAFRSSKQKWVKWGWVQQPQRLISSCGCSWLAGQSPVPASLLQDRLPLYAAGRSLITNTRQLPSIFKPRRKRLSG